MEDGRNSTVRYLMGAEVEGVDTLDINNWKGEGVLGGTGKVVYVVIDDGDTDLFTYYSVVRNLIVKGNRVILLMVDGNTIGKHISMLMASYRQHDIYRIEDKDLISKNYLDILEGREPTEEEVRTFIGSDISAYAEVNELLIELNTSIEDGDLNRVAEIVEGKRDILEDSLILLDFLKSTVEEMAETMESRKTDKTDEEDTGESGEEMERLKGLIDGLENENRQLKSRADEMEARTKELAAQAASTGGPVINTYSSIQTSLVRCKAKSIIYFKEVSYVRYMNSFINKLVETIDKANRLRTKLVIYDLKSNFVNTYKPMTPISSADYFNNRDSIANNMDRVVILEPNPAIIEDILKADYDVLIIYDRLKNNTDIVEGNNVYKYWVINSSHDYSSLGNQKIDKKHVFTRPGVFPDSMALLDVPNYKSGTKSSQWLQYRKMKGPEYGGNTLMNMLLERTNVDSIEARR